MTLLLGPPSSGKTTLLKALAGKLDPDLKAETLFADFVFSWIVIVDYHVLAWIAAFYICLS